MPVQGDAHAKVEALLEANEQFYWEKNADECEKPAKCLLEYNLNRTLAEQLFRRSVELRAARTPAFRLYS